METIAKHVIVVVSVWCYDMRRRELLFGAVSVATGAGLLTGAQGVSRSGSQRTARVAVEGEDDAYVGLEFRDRLTLDGTGNCTETADILTVTNQSKLEFTNFQVDITLDNAGAFEITDTTVPDSLATGESGTVTVTVASAGSENTVATVDLVANTDGDDPQSVLGTQGRFELHRSWELALRANCAVSGPEVSFMAFVPEGAAEATALSTPTVESMARNADGEVTLVEWQSETSVAEVVVYGGREWFLCDGGTHGTAGTNERETDCRKLGVGTCVGEEKPYRCPSSPGEKQQCVKYRLSSDGLAARTQTATECAETCTSEEGN